MSELSHFDEHGASRMVDVGPKPPTQRMAVAQGRIVMTRSTRERIQARDFRKGDVLEVARLAGIMAAKRTADWIPLCHPLALEAVTIDFDFPPLSPPTGELAAVVITAEVRVEAKTGVEMEALTAVSATALTIYDMCKSADRSMVIGELALIEKSGGRSGHYLRAEA